MDWWTDLFPVHEAVSLSPSERNRMLIRERKSRIFWGGKLFDYPVSLSLGTIGKLGLGKTVSCGLGYLRARLFPRKPEQSLEDFFINRFGHELYATFFREYTHKVWGIPCERLAADWGAQRVKGLSLLRLIRHALRSRKRDVRQQAVETSLIERFLYPPCGPGQLWEYVAERIIAQGGVIHLGHTLVALETDGSRIVQAISRAQDGSLRHWEPDHVVSSMPVRDLASALGSALSDSCRALAASLRYRDFFTVGLLLDNLELREQDGAPLRDNWIYVNDPRVLLGRIQFFQNWSPWMVDTPDHAWVGLEYFCNEEDEIWNRPEEELVDLAARELEILGIARKTSVRGGCRIRAPKAYPVYIGEGYARFKEIRSELDAVENLYCIGRNGMHRYNNMDHSMLTAFAAVDAVCGSGGRDAIWNINTESEYHEEKTAPR